ncbi:MAG: cytochrome B6 [Nodosilinea sp.]
MGFVAFVVFLALMVGLALGLYFGLRLVKLI